MQRVIGIAIMALMALASALPAGAREGIWERIGYVSVDRQVRLVAAKIGRELGTFSAIRLEADGGDVFVREVEVVFGNGATEILVEDDIKRVRPGAPLQLDVQGRERFISEVRIEASVSRRRGSETAALHVVGLSAGNPTLKDGWESIETAAYRQGRETIEITIGREHGRIGELALRALDAPLFVRRAEVTFGNGERQIVDVRDRLDEGDLSEPIDLEGRGRLVEKVTLEVRARDRGEVARIQVLGRPPQRRAPRDEPSVAVVGDRVTDTREDAVRIPIGGSDRIARIAIRAVGAAIEPRQITIEFANGTRQLVRVNGTLRDGEMTPMIDLEGARRQIAAVTVGLNPQRRRQSVTVEVLAEEERVASVPGRGASIAERVAETPQLDRRGRPVGFVLFGSQEVGIGSDRDRIDVGREAGQFDQVTLIVRNADVFLRDIVVVYANGERDQISVDRRISGNSVTPAIRLQGDRFIDHIELSYRSRPNRGDRPVVEVYGAYSDNWLSRRTRQRPGDDHWVLLGSQRAQMFNADEDSFVVGQRFGRFKAVRITVKRQDVRFYGMRIIYGNGASEDVPVVGKINNGQTTQIFDLKGRDRFIDRVELKYRTGLSLKGEGIVEVWGLQADPDPETVQRAEKPSAVLKRELKNAIRGLFKQN